MSEPASKFRTVTPAFAVAPQLSAEDMALAAKAGFRTIVCNRPDREDPEMTQAEAEAAAKAAGLAFRALPFAGAPTPDVILHTTQWLAEAEGPVLAYCRSGTRSVTAWAMAQAHARAMTPDEIIEAARGAGYDLEYLRIMLESLRGPRAT